MLHTYMEMEYIAIVALKNIFYTHEKKIRYLEYWQKIKWIWAYKLVGKKIRLVGLLRNFL